MILILAFIGSFSYGQGWAGLGIGGHLTNVSFTNQQGVKDDRIKGVPSAYASFYFQLDLGGPKKNTDAKGALIFEAGYKRGSSKNKESTILEKWVMDFLSGSIQYRYLPGSKRSVNPYFEAGLFGDYLMAGVQQSGIEQYDLTEDIKNFNVGLIGGAGLSYFISSEAYGTLGLSYQRGLSNLEKGNQTAHISGFKLGVSLFFKIDKK